MNRTRLSFVLFSLLLMMFSCKPDDPVQPEGPEDEKNPFVGSWGVEKIEYYNIDYAGNPIESSLRTYLMTPGDSLNGIDLIFREDMTGEMRDRSQDTLWLDYNEQTQVYEQIIICPDTTLINTFSYSYDERSSSLYLNMDYVHTFRLLIENLEDDSFTYVNEYNQDDVERAFLRRLSDIPFKRQSSQKAPFKKGSLLNGRIP